MPSPPGPSHVTINQCDEDEHNNRVEEDADDQNTDISSLLPKHRNNHHHQEEEEEEPTDRATLFQKPHHLKEAEEEEATVNLIVTKQPGGQESELATVHLVIKNQKESGLSAVLPAETTINQLPPTTSTAVRVTNKQADTAKLIRQDSEVNTVTYLLPTGAETVQASRRPLPNQSSPPQVTVTVDHVVLSVERRYEELVDQLPAFVRRFADSLSAAVFSPRGASAPLTRAAAEVVLCFHNVRLKIYHDCVLF
jgi:Na+-translocating ferredoxin:NAD+ oxidoreductase RnfG subunit